MAGDSDSDTHTHRELERLRVRYERERRIRIEAEAIAEAATARLYEADRLRVAFLKTISHELRTPLTAITGFSDVMARNWDTLGEATRLDYLECIRRNGKVLRVLIEEILDLTRVGQGSLGSVTSPLLLSRLVPAVIEELAVVSQSHTVRVDVEDEVWAMADEIAVTRIVDNLLVNAVRYSPEATAIDVSVALRDGWAVVVVADEGPGIPASERAAVFERFYRGNHDAVLRTPGSGIGLALVKELAARMGGRVDIDDSERGGARLSVSLLAAPPPPTPPP